jgi:hypothetical protein
MTSRISVTSGSIAPFPVSGRRGAVRPSGDPEQAAEVAAQPRHGRDCRVHDVCTGLGDLGGTKWQQLAGERQG